MKLIRGFTLVELMVVIAVAAVLMTLVAPSFKHTIDSNNISNAVNTFLADMRFSRSESIRRGGSVVMCRSDAPEAANPSCGTGDGIDFDGDSAGDGWISGWIIFHDLNSDGSKDVGEPILRVQAPIRSIDSIMKSGSTSTIYRFTGTGRLRSISAGVSTLTFGGAKYSSDLQRVVCVSVGGRARVAGNGSTSCSTDY